MTRLELPFHPDDPTFNRSNALYLAHASDVAYFRTPGAAAAERLGLKAFAFRSKVTRLRGFLGVCESHAVLSFRGSDPVTLPNWLTNASARLVERGEYEGRVHHGFAVVLGQAWNWVERAMDEAGDRPLFLTGHSMGGALAVLTACRLAKMGRPAVATYTFGSPRIGDPKFCAAYELPTYRVVNRLDLVPEVPLASVQGLLPEKPRLTNEKILGQLKQLAGRLPCYEHVRTLVYIDMDGEITTDAQVVPWRPYAVARAIATRGKSFTEGITDHLISNYIRGLEGRGGSTRATGVRRR